MPKGNRDKESNRWNHLDERVIQKRYTSKNSAGVYFITIPIEVIRFLNLQNGDIMKFEVIKSGDTKTIIIRRN